MAKEINDMDLMRSNTLRALREIADGTTMNYVDKLPDDLKQLVDISDKLSKQYLWTTWILGHIYSKLKDDWKKFEIEKVYGKQATSWKVFCNEILKRGQHSTDDHIHLYKTISKTEIALYIEKYDINPSTLLLVSRIEKEDERETTLKEASNNDWSFRQVENYIKTKGGTAKEETKPKEVLNDPPKTFLDAAKPDYSNNESPEIGPPWRQNLWTTKVSLEDMFIKYENDWHKPEIKGYLLATIRGLRVQIELAIKALEKK